jgi:hypothetical protein
MAIMPMPPFVVAMIAPTVIAPPMIAPFVMAPLVMAPVIPVVPFAVMAEMVVMVPFGVLRVIGLIRDTILCGGRRCTDAGGADGGKDQTERAAFEDVHWNSPSLERGGHSVSLLGCEALLGMRALNGSDTRMADFVHIGNELYEQIDCLIRRR